MQIVLDQPLRLPEGAQARADAEKFARKLNTTLAENPLLYNNANSYKSCDALYPSDDWVLVVCDQ